MNELIRPYILKRQMIAKPWAGTGLKSLFTWATDLPLGTGETVEAADLAGLVTPLFESEHTLNSLMQAIGQKAMLGYETPVEPTFPLMLKFLDTAAPLSLQCHPHDAFSKGKAERLSFGKEEAWLVLHAEEGAAILQGVRPECQGDFWARIEAGEKPEALMNHRVVSQGDFVHSPCGMVHSIGAGLTLLEVQQACNTTWRIADFPDVNGKNRGREMHLAEAKRDARIQFSCPPIKSFVPKRGDAWFCEEFYGENFQVNAHRVGEDWSIGTDLQYASIFTVLDGTAVCDWKGGAMVLEAGESCIAPAALESISFGARSGPLWVIESTPLPPTGLRLPPLY